VVKRFSLLLDGQRYDVEWEGNRVLVDGHAFEVEFPEEGVVLVDGQRHAVELKDSEAVVDGIVHAIEVNGLGPGPAGDEQPKASGASASAAADADAVTAIMPGKIVQVLVSEGEEVSADQVVCVLEAMKMQNELRVPKDGTVAEVRVRPGQDVEMGAVLIVVS